MPKPTTPPDQGAASSDEERFSVTVDRQTYEQIEFLAVIWNAIDAGRRVKRYRKWGVSNISPALIRAAVSGIMEELGGLPKTETERHKAMVSAVAEALSRDSAKGTDVETLASRLVDEASHEAKVKSVRDAKRKK